MSIYQIRPKDMADQAIVDLLDYLVRLAELEQRNDMAAVVQDAHDKCLELYANRLMGTSKALPL